MRWGQCWRARLGWRASGAAGPGSWREPGPAWCAPAWRMVVVGAAVVTGGSPPTHARPNPPPRPRPRRRPGAVPGCPASARAGARRGVTGREVGRRAVVARMLMSGGAVRAGRGGHSGARAASPFLTVLHLAAPPPSRQCSPAPRRPLTPWAHSPEPTPLGRPPESPSARARPRARFRRGRARWRPRPRTPPRPATSRAPP